MTLLFFPSYQYILIVAGKLAIREIGKDYILAYTLANIDNELYRYPDKFPKHLFYINYRKLWVEEIVKSKEYLTTLRL